MTTKSTLIVYPQEEQINNSYAGYYKYWETLTANGVIDRFECKWMQLIDDKMYLTCQFEGYTPYFFKQLWFYCEDGKDKLPSLLYGRILPKLPHSVYFPNSDTTVIIRKTKEINITFPKIKEFTLTRDYSIPDGYDEQQIRIIEFFKKFA